MKIKTLFTTLMFLLLSTTTYAQMFIEQGKIVETVRPGGTLKGSVVIHNTSDKDIGIKAYWEDFLYIEPFDGSKEFLPKGTVDRSIGTWVRLSPEEFSLPAFGKKEVSYIINVPQEAKGGYNGVLFFENAKPDVKSQTGMKIVTRVGSLFFIDSADKTIFVDYTDLTLENSQLKGKLSNQGDVIMIPNGVYYIMNEEGLVVDRAETKKVYLPANKQADFEVPFKDDLVAGNYSLILTLDLGSDHVLVKEIDFTKTYTGELKINQITH